MGGAAKENVPIVKRRLGEKKSKPAKEKEVEQKYEQDPQLQGLLAILDKALTGKNAWGGKRMRKVPTAVMHGRMGDPAWLAPRLMVECDEEARPGYTSKKAHEYEEEPEILREKVKLLAELITKARFPLAYTGAGISTASGIKDYASKAKNSIAMKRKKVRGFEAQPTLAHRVLSALHHQGKLAHWVQQNHDGLPQKAGFPPEHLNEIHGAWFDPSNPVVPMSGTLRSDLCDWMEDWEEKTDLSIAMGTSLCGMNADRMVETPARKASRRRDPDGLGAVIIGLQRTQYDEQSSLRIYAKIDDVMALLAREMGLIVKSFTLYKPTLPSRSVIKPLLLKVPYDAQGRLTTDENKMVPWDLRKGATVQVTSGPGEGFVGVITGTNPEGHIRVRLPRQREGSPQHGKEWVVYLLGLWWLETAANGKAPLLPVVNTTLPATIPAVTRKIKAVASRDGGSLSDE